MLSQDPQADIFKGGGKAQSKDVSGAQSHTKKLSQTENMSGNDSSGVKY